MIDSCRTQHTVWWWRQSLSGPSDSAWYTANDLVIWSDQFLRQLCGVDRRNFVSYVNSCLVIWLSLIVDGGPRFTIRLSHAKRQALINDTRFHWSTLLSSSSNWSNHMTESDSGLGPLVVYWMAWLFALTTSNLQWWMPLKLRQQSSTIFSSLMPTWQQEWRRLESVSPKPH